MHLPVNTAAPALILASSSSYRRELLQRLALPFTCISPELDESALPGEGAAELAQRLAREKAHAVARQQPHAVVIGSDQLAVHRDQRLGKPGTAERACQQLRSLSGQEVIFHTAVHVMQLSTGIDQAHLDLTTVQFRELQDDEIRRYVAHDQPLNCAGGFKMEALGIALFERIRTDDPTALIGLPMIWVAGALRGCGWQVP